MARLTLRLLGAFEAGRSSTTEPIRLGKKPKALLAYLAFAPGPYARDQLAGLLWGDVEQDQARHGLRQTLFGLRKSFGPDAAGVLVTSDDTVAVDDVDVDVPTFETLARSEDVAALEQALVLYRGDLLAGLRLDEAPFEDWLSAQRERLRRMALDAGTRLLDIYAAGGATERAVETGLRLLAIDPAREMVHRALMTLYLRSGQPDAAERQYDRCVRALRRDLGVAPGAETRRLHQEVLAAIAGEDTAATPAPRPIALPRPAEAPAGPPLVGRQREISLIGRALDALMQGEGRTLAILGSAGIGKSRLVHHLAEQAWQRSGRVLVARCHETEQSLPFAPWIDALRTGHVIAGIDRFDALHPVWRHELSRLFPELGHPDARTNDDVATQPRLFDALGELIGLIAGAEPLVLVLEDAHWADEPSLRLLAYLAHRLTTSQLLAVATVRTGEDETPILRQFLNELHRDPRATIMRLGPLTRAETRELVHTLATGAAPASLDPVVDEVWRASEGQPLIAVETWRDLRDNDAPRDRLGVPLPERWRQLIGRRLDRLGATARAVVDSAAVLDRAADVGLLAAVAGLDEADTTAALDELLRREVIRVVDGAFDFAHDRIRAAAYASIPPASRGRLHHRVADTLAARHGDDPAPIHGTLAFHYQQAGLWAPALTHARRAGSRALLYGAVREAAAACEQAIVALDALPQTPQHLADAIDLRIDLRHALVTVGDNERIGEILAQAESFARRLEDPARLGPVLAFSACHFWWRGEYPTALARCEQAIEIARATGDPGLMASILYYQSQARHGAGEYRLAADDARAMRALGHGGITSRRFGSTDFRDVLGSSWLVWSLAELGDFAAASAHAREAVRQAEAGHLPLLQMHAAAASAMCEFRRGDTEAAVVHCERLREIARTGKLMDPLPELFLLHAYALLRRPEAATLLTTGSETPADRTFFYYPFFLGWYAEAHLMVHGPEAAAPFAAEALTLASARGEHGHAAWILLLHGDIALAASPPNTVEAGAGYRQALAIAMKHGMKPLEARCHAGLAAVYERTRESTQATRHRRLAEKLAATLGMRLPARAV